MAAPQGRSDRSPTGQFDAASSASSYNPTASASASDGDPEQVTVGSVQDTPAERDDLGFRPYVYALYRFLTSTETKAPLTVSIEGEWGSGKSSFLVQLKDQLRRKGHSVVYFNAWRHDGEEALWAAFALEFVEQLSRAQSILVRVRAHLTLALRRFRWGHGWKSVLWTVFLAVTLAFATGSVVAHLRAGHLEQLKAALLPAKPSEGPKDDGSKPAQGKVPGSNSNGDLLGLLLGIGGITGYAAIVFISARRVIDIFGNPLAVDLRRYIDDPHYEDRTSFIEHFHRDFGKIIDAYSPEGKTFVFIDDLDRCEVPRAADLMQALNLLTSSDTGGVVFLLALDREMVAASIAAKYQAILPYVAAESDSATSVSRRAALAYGHSFLEKFIQLPFRVPQPDQEDLSRMLSRAGQALPIELDVPATPEGESVVRIVEGRDSARLQRIVEMVAPALGSNPRRLKHFINLFRLRVYLANATGLFEMDSTRPTAPLTPEQLGKYVALILRWPDFGAALVKDPFLLASIEEGLTAGTSSESLGVEVRRWLENEAFTSLLRTYITADGRVVTVAAQQFLMVSPDCRMEHVDISRLLRISDSRIPEDDYLESRMENQPPLRGARRDPHYPPESAPA